MKIEIKAKGKVKKINSNDYAKLLELCDYLIEKYDVKVNIKKFKVNYE